MIHHDLERFVEAQDRVYGSALAELRAGQKYGHWMWFIFPQIHGLGASPTARQYAIVSRDEAEAYVEQTILGRRLTDCTRVVLDVEGRSAEEIFGYPDVLKFRSCMTLFSQAARDSGLYVEALVKYFGGKPDQMTLDILSQQER